MKPRTEREREVMRLHASLPAITKAQREWAIDHCFDAVGYICKGIVWCTKCGGQFEKKTSDLSVSLKVEDKAVCPHCGRKLELKVSRKKKIKDTEYMTVLTTKGRWQVFRHYLVDRAMYRVSGNLDGCDKPSIYVWEVVQNWIDEHGSELVEENNGSMGEKEYYAYCMGKCVEALLMCDGIVLCHGWFESKGCRAECDVAQVYGKMIRVDKTEYADNQV